MLYLKSRRPPALSPLPAKARRQFLRQLGLAVGSTGALAHLPLKSEATTTAAPASCPGIRIPMKDVQGKVAFITGGDSGIGLGIARAFSNAGMKVCITYRTPKHLSEAKDALRSSIDRIHAINVDVSDREGMSAAAEETVRVFGRLHVLVNNAGVDLGGIPLENTTFDDWDWVMGVNVNGVFNGIRAFLPKIRAHGEGGHVVSTSSIQGLIARNGGGLYSVTRFAVVGLMEALRWELSDTNIGVSVFCPGGVLSNIGDSNRNRPRTLAETGKPDFSQPAVRAAELELEELMSKNHGVLPLMDPLEAGERVLKGIQNNDLYILSHAEFEQGIRDRNEALLASIPVDDRAPPEGRVAVERVADILRNPIYYNERDRKLCERSRGRNGARPKRP